MSTKRPSVIVLSDLIQKFIGGDYDRILEVSENLEALLAANGLTLTVDYTAQGFPQTTLGDLLEALTQSVTEVSALSETVPGIEETIATLNDTLAALALSLENDLTEHINANNAALAAHVVAVTDALNDISIIGDVQSVNGETGTVVLDPDHLDDSTSVNKFASAVEKATLALLTVVNPVDLDDLVAAVAVNSAKVGISVGQAADIVTNNAKVSNVPTTLEIGTHSATTLAITSDGGADDITLPQATDTLSGLLSAADKVKLTDIAEGAQVNPSDAAINAAVTFGSEFVITTDAGSDSNSTTTYASKVAYTIPSGSPSGIYLCTAIYHASVDSSGTGIQIRLTHNSTPITDPNYINVSVVHASNDRKHSSVYPITHVNGVASVLDLEFRRQDSAGNAVIKDASLIVYRAT